MQPPPAALLPPAAGNSGVALPHLAYVASSPSSDVQPVSNADLQPLYLSHWLYWSSLGKAQRRARAPCTNSCSVPPQRRLHLSARKKIPAIRNDVTCLHPSQLASHSRDRTLCPPLQTAPINGLTQVCGGKDRSQHPSGARPLGFGG